MSIKHHESRDGKESAATGAPNISSGAAGPQVSSGARQPGSEDSAPVGSSPETTAATASDSSASESPKQETAGEGDILVELETKLASLEAELAASREALSALNDKYLRKLADDVNFRRRLQKDKEDAQRFAVASLLNDLIPVLDDFDRGIASAEKAMEYKALHDGVTLIRRQMGQMLDTKYGLKRIEAVGCPFDPNHHEAVAVEVARAGDEILTEPVVAEEFLPGYGLQERVIRTAKVKVRMPAPVDEKKAGDSQAAAEKR